MIESGENRIAGFHRGKVVDNQDPQKLGRIKVEIQHFFNNIPSKYLPWAVPALPIISGSGNNYGWFAVPEIGSYVWCFFEAGDLNQPVYFAEAVSGVCGHPSTGDINYPNRRGFRTKSGHEVYVDDESDVICINHSSGSKIVIRSGKIDLEASHVNASGASGTFHSADDPKKTITVRDGIIISIS